MAWWIDPDTQEELRKRYNQEREKLDKHIAAYSSQPRVAARLTEWADYAPMLPPGVLIAFAKANVPYKSRLGTWAVSHGSVAMADLSDARKERKTRATAHDKYAPALQFLSNQARVNQLAEFDEKALTRLEDVGAEAFEFGDKELSRMAQNKDPTKEPTGLRGFVHDVGDITTSSTRASFAGLQAGAEAVDAAFRAGVSGVASVTNPQQRRAGLRGVSGKAAGVRPSNQVPEFTEFGENVRVSTDLDVLLNPKQLTVYNYAKGESLGHGILPSLESPAAITQREAAREAGYVRLPDGQRSALTPGRFVGASIVEPGSLEYEIVSGLVDLGVDWKLDPANLALDAFGAYRGARKFVDPNKFARQMDSRTGQKILQILADETDIRTLNQKLNRTGHFPAELLAPLQEARTPQAVRDILQPAIMRGQAMVPRTARKLDPIIRDRLPRTLLLGYDWRRSAENWRWATSMPTGKFFVGDMGNNLKQAERLMVTGKVDAASIESVMSRLARVSTKAELYDVVVHDMDIALRKSALDEYGMDPDRFHEVSSYFDRTMQEMSEFVHDDLGNPATMRVPFSTGDEVLPVIGPMAEADFLQNGIPLPDLAAMREMRKSTSALSKVKFGENRIWDSNFMFGSTAFADFLFSNIWKPAQLLRGAWTVRVIAEEQLRMAADGLDSLVNHPIRALGITIGRRGRTDVMETDMQELAAKTQGEQAFYVQAQVSEGKGSLIDIGGSPYEDMIVDGWGTTPRVDPGYTRAWADRITHAAGSPDLREVARGMRDPNYQPGWLAARGPAPTPWSKFEEKLVDSDYGPLPTDEFLDSDEFLDEFGAVLADLRTKPLTEAESAIVGRAEQHVAAQGMYPRDPSRFVPDGEGGYLGVHRATHGDYQRAQRDVTMFADVRDLAARHAAAAPEGALPTGLDAVKQSFWDGPLAETRRQMMAANLMQGRAKEILGFREGADAWINSMVKRIETLTGGPAHAGGDPDLLDVFANGKMLNWTGDGQVATKELMNHLSDMRKVSQGPDAVHGPVYKKNKERQRPLDRAVRWLFNGLMTIPTNKLSRQSAFKQFYWREIEESLPYADAAAQAEMIRVGRKNKFKMKLPKATGELTLNDVDLAAKGRALDATRQLLYDITEKGNGWDALRFVFPFGEAFKEVTTRWAKLVYEKPNLIRRGQQIIYGARAADPDHNGRGFFYTDPADGKEYFTYPASGAFSRTVGKVLEAAENIPFGGEWTRAIIPDSLTGEGLPFDMRGSVESLNIIGSGLPAVGPAIQIPADQFLPKTSKTQWMHDYISPYGEPDSDFLSYVAPGWFDRLRAGGWLGPITPSAAQERIYENSVIDATMYNASTGQYDTMGENAEEEIGRMVADAKHKAQGLTFWRSLAQGILPASPQIVPKIEGKDGGLVEVYVIAQDYQKMKDRHDGDWAAATIEFINKYGKTAYFVLEPRGVRQVYGVPTTKQAELWRSEHEEFATNYKDVYGYFAPQGGDFDYSAYIRAIARGEIKPQDVEEWVDRANDRIGSALYATKRSQIGTNPTQEQETALANYRAQLRKEFPGYDPTALNFGKSTTRLVQQMEAAIEHKDVRNTELARATGAFIRLRRQALEEIAAKQGDGKTADQVTLSSKMAAPWREWLRGKADKLVHVAPEFLTVYDGVFSREIRVTDDELAGEG